MTMTRDGALIGALDTARDVPSFERVFHEHFDFVWRALRGLGVPESSVEDAAQDVFLVVVRRLHEFDGRAALSSWLFAIAIGVARNHRRLLRRKGGHETIDDSLPARGPSPADEAEIRASIARLGELLDTLDEDHRIVLVLTEIEEMTAPEIATLTGWKVNTVSSRLRRARQALEAALARAGLGR